MKLKAQKRIAGNVAKRSPKRIRFDTSQLEKIKESITKTDVRHLIKNGTIKTLQKKGVSRARAKHKSAQKKKGRQRGHGSRKGTANARSSQKKEWIARIRKQRKLLTELKQGQKVTNEVHKQLYYKAKGGFFRSVRHMKLYMNEKDLFAK